MSIELDHVFILTAPGAPAGDRLNEVGLTEGAAGRHPGQGTANRRFFFSNLMLELLYIADRDEAVDGPGSRLGLAVRAEDRLACPFGLVFRPEAELQGSRPFPGWPYFPDYLEAPLHFHVGSNSDDVLSPMCICMPFGMPTPGDVPRSPEPFDHVTGVTVSFASKNLPEALSHMSDIEGLSLRGNQPHSMELEFNHAARGRRADLQPELPLVLRW